MLDGTLWGVTAPMFVGALLVVFDLHVPYLTSICYVHDKDVSTQKSGIISYYNTLFRVWTSWENGRNL